MHVHACGAHHVEQLLPAAEDGKESTLLSDRLGARKLGRRLGRLAHVVGVPRVRLVVAAVAVAVVVAAAATVAAATIARRRRRLRRCLDAERILLHVRALAAAAVVVGGRLGLDAHDVSHDGARHVKLVLGRSLALLPPKAKGKARRAAP